MEIGKIKPVKVPADQVADNSAAEKIHAEEESNSGKSKKISVTWILPILLFVFLMIIILTHKNSLPAALLFLLGFLFIYIFSIPRALKLARLGNKALAIKTVAGAFIPLLGSANAAFFKFISSDLVQRYFVNAEYGAGLFKDWLVSVSPEYGNYIYTGLIGTVIVGVNLIIIKEFSKITAGLIKIAGN